MKPITLVVIAACTTMNLVAFGLMIYDKHCAEKNKRRIPEKALFLACALFGAFGGTLAMFLFRHKTKHWYFRFLFPLMLVLQASVIGYLIGREIL